MQAEADRGIMAAEFDALEAILGRVEGSWPDAHLRVPEDSDERAELIDCFVRVGWCRSGATPEPGGDRP